MQQHASVPAQAGTHDDNGARWVPAFAGMTKVGAVAE
ncbi:hypothetical protein GGC65_003006 [Sphingopyxis sp. OAS728]|nr:hypothetical protein [Sphingopyxis sp. OAS728]